MLTLNPFPLNDREHGANTCKFTANDRDHGTKHYEFKVYAQNTSKTNDKGGLIHRMESLTFRAIVLYLVKSRFD